MMMNKSKIENLRGWLKTKAARKLGIWLLISLALSVVFLRGFWSGLPAILSPSYILAYHASPWGVLGLCLIFLWLKRKTVWTQMSLRTNLAFILLGLAMAAAAVLTPFTKDFWLFQVMLAALGVFTIIFGAGVKIPALLLAIYGFAIAFPLAIEKFAESTYSQTAIAPLMGLMTMLGFTLHNQGQLVHFTTYGGQPIWVSITSACAGPATMGVFIALFSLMMLDMPLRPHKAVTMFLFGVVGTWFQSFIRLVFLLLVAFYLGGKAMWTAHYWTIYLLFPLWYLLFAYFYLRQLKQPFGMARHKELKNILNQPGGAQ